MRRDNIHCKHAVGALESAEWFLLRWLENGRGCARALRILKAWLKRRDYTQLLELDKLAILL